MKTILSIIILLPFTSCSQSSESKFEYVNTFVDARNPDVLYNAFKFDDAIILVADNRSFDSISIQAYLEGWKERVKKPLEGHNVFILDTTLNSLARAEHTKLNKDWTLWTLRESGAYSAVVDGGHVYLQGSTKSSEKTFGKKWTLVATVYECTDSHSGSPHSGVDKEELKKTYGCTRFQAKIF